MYAPINVPYAKNFNFRVKNMNITTAKAIYKFLNSPNAAGIFLESKISNGFKLKVYMFQNICVTTNINKGINLKIEYNINLKKFKTFFKKSPPNIFICYYFYIKLIITLYNLSIITYFKCL